MLKALHAASLVVLVFASRIASADDQEVCARNDYKPLLTAIHSNFRTAITPKVKQFFVDLYSGSGIAITVDQVSLSEVTDGMIEPYFEVKVDAGTNSHTFGSRIIAMPGVTDIVTADNAKWDNLGNLITPATEVTCTGAQNFDDNIGFYNTATNHSVGGMKMPEELKCSAHGGCDVAATVVLRI